VNPEAKGLTTRIKTTQATPRHGRRRQGWHRRRNNSTGLTEKEITKKKKAGRSESGVFSNGLRTARKKSAREDKNPNLRRQVLDHLGWRIVN